MSKKDDIKKISLTETQKELLGIRAQEIRSAEQTINQMLQRYQELKEQAKKELRIPDPENWDISPDGTAFIRMGEPENE